MQSSVEYSKSAQSLFDDGQFDEGIELLLKAIAANPGDAGHYIDSSSYRSIDAVALKHGEAQLKQMLRDRPAMARCLKPGDKLWTWAVRKFAGEDSQGLVLWEPKDPSPLNSDSRSEWCRPWIAVRDITTVSPDSSCDAIWASFVYEMYRIADMPERFALLDQIRAGEITEDECVLKWMALSEKAIEKARAFYVTMYASARLAAGATKLWPAHWHCFRFFPNPDLRAQAWRADPHWRYFRSYSKLAWVLSISAWEKPEQVTLYLQELKASEATLPLALRAALYWHLAVADSRKGDMQAAAAHLEIAEQLWPGAQSTEEARAYLFPDGKSEKHK